MLEHIPAYLKLKFNKTSLSIGSGHEGLYLLKIKYNANI